ncbi:MAG: SDR family NAD(P)-dependent oxidoreductase [Chitinophagales bacterium]
MVEEFGGIDILINNASAINLSPTLQLPMKRYDLMHQVNTRGTFMTPQKCIPYLKQSTKSTYFEFISPLNMEPRWFGTLPLLIQ